MVDALGMVYARGSVYEVRGVCRQRGMPGRLPYLKIRENGMVDVLHEFLWQIEEDLPGSAIPPARHDATSHQTVQVQFSQYISEGASSQ